MQAHSRCNAEKESEQEKTRSRKTRQEGHVGAGAGDNGGWKHGGGEQRKSRRTGETLTRSNQQDSGINRMEGGGGQIPKASKMELEYWAGSLTIEALVTDLPSVSYPVALTKALTAVVSSRYGKSWGLLILSAVQFYYPVIL